MALRARNTAVQVKLEVTEGTDPGSWTSADVLLCSELTPAANYEQIALDEYGGTLDRGPTIAGPPSPTVPMSGYLRGSGTPQTATAPFTAALEAGALTPTSYATTFPSTSTTTATSGTTTTAVIDRTAGNGADWPAASGLASGLIGRWVEVGGNPATTTVAPIVDYQVVASNATITFGFKFAVALSAATTLKRVAQTVWEATTPTPQKSCYVRCFYDGLMEAFPGARPSISFQLEAGQPGRFSFQFGGQYAGRSDVANPTAPSALQPALFKHSTVSLTSGILGATHTLAAVPLAVRSLSIETGNEGDYPLNANALQARDPYVVGGRRISATLDPLAVAVSERDLAALLSAGTLTTICALIGYRTGGTAGNRFGFVLRDMQLSSADITADNLVRREAIQASSGAFDYGLIISQF
jgi:hypothetical protein